MRAVAAVVVEVEEPVGCRGEDGDLFEVVGTLGPLVAELVGTQVCDDVGLPRYLVEPEVVGRRAAAKLGKGEAATEEGRLFEKPGQEHIGSIVVARA